MKAILQKNFSLILWAVMLVLLSPGLVQAQLIEDAKLTASDAEANDRFGHSVAISGDTAVVGAEGNDDGNTETGSAYVFVRSGGAWTQQAKLTASDPAFKDHFGFSVAISGDTVVVGANDDDDKGENSGSVYVFVRSGTTWEQKAKLTASDGAAGDQFGRPVAISGDTVVVGAGFTCPLPPCVYPDHWYGSVYVFVKPAGGWNDVTADIDSNDSNGIQLNQNAKLTASDAAADQQLGLGIAISEDQTTVVAGGSSNSAYVFVKPGAGWVDAAEDAKLLASDAAAGDIFGRSVAISGDTVVAGAQSDDDGSSNSGSAYVFVKPAGGWDDATADIDSDDFNGIQLNQQAKLTASDPAADDNFGGSVAISGDTVVVGALNDDGLRGSAYMFVRSGGAWTQQAKLAASDAAVSDFFGGSVAISGLTAVAGAEGDDDYVPSSGSAYVFDLPSPTPEDRIQFLLDQLDDLVTSGDLKQGQATGLKNPLQNALRNLAKDKTNSVCSALQDFIDEVNQKYWDGALSWENALALIDQAMSIREDLGCW